MIIDHQARWDVQASLRDPNALQKSEILGGGFAVGRIIRLSQIKLARGRLSTLLTNFPLLNSKSMGELRTSIYITV